MEKLKLWLNGARKSRTIWFNSAVGTLTTLVVMWPEFATQLQAILSPEQYAKVLLVVVIVNIYLRVKTNTALTDK